MFAIEFFNWYDDIMWEQENRLHSSVHMLKIHRVSEKSSASYFAEYFRSGLTDCKNFNGYRVRDNQWTQVCNQCFNFNFQRAEVLPPGELTCIKLSTVRAQKLHIFWRYLSWSSFCPFVACLLIALDNHSFYWSKCYYRIFDMFRAQYFSFSNKTVPSSPSQGNSCTVNDWDTWFYSAYVTVASELLGPRSCW